MASTAVSSKLYEVLCLPHFSSIPEIRTAYKTLALKYHPDKNLGDPEAAEKFKEVKDAYELLSNEEKKKKYDLQLQVAMRKMEGRAKGKAPPSSSSNASFTSLFQMNNMFSHSRQRRTGATTSAFTTTKAAKNTSNTTNSGNTAATGTSTTSNTGNTRSSSFPGRATFGAGEEVKNKTNTTPGYSSATSFSQKAAPPRTASASRRRHMEEVGGSANGSGGKATDSSQKNGSFTSFPGGYGWREERGGLPTTSSPPPTDASSSPPMGAHTASSASPPPPLNSSSKLTPEDRFRRVMEKHQAEKKRLENMKRNREEQKAMEREREELRKERQRKKQEELLEEERLKKEKAKEDYERWLRAREKAEDEERSKLAEQEARYRKLRERTNALLNSCKEYYQHSSVNARQKPSPNMIPSFSSGEDGYSDDGSGSGSPRGTSGNEEDPPDQKAETSHTSWERDHSSCLPSSSSKSLRFDLAQEGRVKRDGGERSDGDPRGDDHGPTKGSWRGQNPTTCEEETEKLKTFPFSYTPPSTFSLKSSLQSSSFGNLDPTSAARNERGTNSTGSPPARSGVGSVGGHHPENTGRNKSASTSGSILGGDGGRKPVDAVRTHVTSSPTFSSSSSSSLDKIGGAPSVISRLVHSPLVGPERKVEKISPLDHDSSPTAKRFTTLPTSMRGTATPSSHTAFNQNSTIHLSSFHTEASKRVSERESRNRSYSSSHDSFSSVKHRYIDEIEEGIDTWKGGDSFSDSLKPPPLSGVEREMATRGGQRYTMTSTGRGVRSSVDVVRASRSFFSDQKAKLQELEKLNKGLAQRLGSRARRYSLIAGERRRSVNSRSSSMSVSNSDMEDEQREYSVRGTSPFTRHGKQRMHAVHHHTEVTGGFPFMANSHRQRPPSVRRGPTAIDTDLNGGEREPPAHTANSPLHHQGVNVEHSPEGKERSSNTTRQESHRPHPTTTTTVPLEEPAPTEGTGNSSEAVKKRKALPREKRRPEWVSIAVPHTPSSPGPSPTETPVMAENSMKKRKCNVPSFPSGPSSIPVDGTTQEEEEGDEVAQLIKEEQMSRECEIERAEREALRRILRQFPSIIGDIPVRWGAASVFPTSSALSKPLPKEEEKEKHLASTQRVSDDLLHTMTREKDMQRDIKRNSSTNAFPIHGPPTESGKTSGEKEKQKIVEEEYYFRCGILNSWSTSRRFMMHEIFEQLGRDATIAEEVFKRQLLGKRFSSQLYEARRREMERKAREKDTGPRFRAGEGTGKPGTESSSPMGKTSSLRVSRPSREKRAVPGREGPRTPRTPAASPHRRDSTDARGVPSALCTLGSEVPYAVRPDTALPTVPSPPSRASHRVPVSPKGEIVQNGSADPHVGEDTVAVEGSSVKETSSLPRTDSKETKSSVFHKGTPGAHTNRNMVSSPTMMSTQGNASNNGTANGGAVNRVKPTISLRRPSEEGSNSLEKSGNYGKSSNSPMNAATAARASYASIRRLEEDGRLAVEIAEAEIFSNLMHERAAGIHKLYQKEKEAAIDAALLALQRSEVERQ